jgi:hypothetical protein
MAIDILAFVKVLEAAGVPREQAEAQVVALAQHALADVATRDDLAEVKDEVAALRAGMAIKADLAGMKYALTWRLFDLMLGVSGLMNGILFALLRLTHTQRVFRCPL